MTQDAPIETDALDYDTEEVWLEEPEELPRRPRRKLLGVGGNPVAVTLLVVLLLACAFLAGVEVEKGQTSSGTGAGLPAGLSALRSRLAAGGTSSSSSSATGSSGGRFRGGAGGFPAAAGGGFPGAGGLAGGGVTIGEVSFASGDTLYVTSGEGNTVKVTVPAGTNVSKTITTNLHSVHPGETVIVRGSQNKNGSVSASSITVSPSGGSGAGLFGGSGASGGSSGAAGGGATQKLFGAG